MSAEPISAAQTTATQAGSGTQGANASAGAQKTQKGPPTGFEALLAMLSAAQDGAAAAPKSAVKINPKAPDAATGDKGGNAAAEAAPHHDDGSSDASATDVTSAAIALLVPSPQPVIVATTIAQTAQGEAGGPAKGAATAAGAKTDSAALATVLAKANEATPAVEPTPQATQPADPNRLAVADPAPFLAQPLDAPPTAKPEPAGLALAQAVTTAAAASDKSQAAPTPAAQPVPEALAAPPEATPVVAATAGPDLTASAAQAGTPSVTPSAQAPSKDRTAGTKPPRIDGVRTAPATAGAGAISAKMAQGAQSQAQVDLAVADANTDQTGVPVPETAVQAQADTAAGPLDAGPELTAASTATGAPVATTHTTAVEVRGQPQTVAALAAQIVRKLDGRSTHFDVALDPVGLGHVNVRVEIGATGKMSAALAFDTPQAAAELRGRAGELRTAMEQAGFDLSGGLSFDVASDRGQGAPGQDNQAGQSFRGRAFQTAQDTVGDPVTAAPLYLRRSSASGVDIRI